MNLKEQLQAVKAALLRIETATTSNSQTDELKAEMLSLEQQIETANRDALATRTLRRIQQSESSTTLQQTEYMRHLFKRKRFAHLEGRSLSVSAVET
eukprot:scaffold248495_cov46-Prasinocladus_malaysianus.AAC.1